MALLDWLFGGGTNFTPGTYDYFRGLYPPATRPEVPFAGLPAPASAPDVYGGTPFGSAYAPSTFSDLRSPLGTDALTVTSPYGPRKQPITGASINHMGTDMVGGQPSGDGLGQPIYPSAPGKIVAMGENQTSGKFVRIQHNDGTVTSYAHLSGFGPFKQGDLVTDPTNEIGYMGATGVATGPHLHFGVQANGRFVDPMKALGTDVGSNTNIADANTRMMYQPPWSGRNVVPASSPNVVAANPIASAAERFAAPANPVAAAASDFTSPANIYGMNLKTLVGDVGRAPAPAGSAPLGLMADNWVNTIGDVSPTVLSAINATAPKPATPPTPTPRTPFNWGADNYPLWGGLMALGQGLTQPTLYGFGGSLSQGISKAAEFGQKAPLTAAQIQLTRAQAGMAQQKADAQAALNDFATKMNLPAGVKLSILLNPEKAYDILKVHDPSVAGEWLKYQAQNAKAETTGKLEAETSPANIAGQSALKGAITQAEQANTLGPLGKDIQDIKRILPSGTDAKGFTSIMGMTPEQYVQQRIAKEAGTVPGQQAQQQIAGFGMTRDSLNQVISILSNPEQGNLLSPKQYADLNQAWKRAVLAYGLATGRGANYTEMEKNLVESGLGQNPLDFAQRGMQDREAFIARYRNSLGYLDQQIGHIRNAPYVQPGQTNSWNLSASGIRYRTVQ